RRRDGLRHLRAGLRQPRAAVQRTRDGAPGGRVVRTPPVLWQTEWCPASRRVRQRLTELGVEYVARQVPVEREERGELVEATGQTSIPALVDYLHCTVVVYQRIVDTRIAAYDAERMLWIVGNDELAPTAAEERERLARVVERAAV